MREFGGTWGLREYGVLALLFVSGVLWSIGVLGEREVYPAPVLPSFGGVPDADRPAPTSWEVLVLSPGADALALTPAELFPNVPDSQWDNLFTSTINNASSVEVAAWIATRAERAAGVACSSEILVRQVAAVAAGDPDGTVAAGDPDGTVAASDTSGTVAASDTNSTVAAGDTSVTVTERNEVFDGTCN